MEEKVFIEYIDIQTQIKKLEDQKKELSVKCLEEMKKNELNQVKNPLGTFSLVEKKTWTYSNAIKLSEGAIKELKKAEEENGIAISKVSESLRFQLVK